MPAHSPVVINTSSPFITPPSVPQSLGRAATSSSPYLLSPSALVRPRTAALKTGSRAEKVPDGVATGFASAGSLLKSGLWAFASDVQDGGDRGASRREKGRIGLDKQAGTEGTGKLVRPRKKRKTEEAEESAANVTTDVTDEPSGYFRAPIGEVIAVADKFEAEAGTIASADAETAAGTEHGRRPSVTIFDYAFGAPGRDENVATKAKPRTSITKTTKVRKRPAKKADDQDPSLARKPRKRKAKSASFILNSDEPEPTEVLAQPSEPVLGADPLIDSGTSETPLRCKGFAAFVFGQDIQQDAENSELPIPKRLPELAADDEISCYFAGARGQATSVQTTSAPDAHSPTDPIHPELPTKSPIHISHVASRRRLSWTPQKDTSTTLPAMDTPPTPTQEASPDKSPPKRELASVLTSFGYVSDQPALTIKPKPVVSAETATKRRRIELGDASTNAPAARKQEQGSVTDKATITKPAKEKQPKKPKKVQTITALATAPFQPAATPCLTDAGAMVSEFFVIREQHPLVPTEVATIPAERSAPAKPTKPRKPRTKKVALDNNDGSDKQTTKAKARSKTVKVKFNEADHKAQLYSPGRAVAQIESQDFVFGTSSQLAVDEDAAFIRDMQAAVKESEVVQQPLAETAASPPSWKSCVRVPTAPHGTNLSVQQAEKGHWCHAARDFKGGVVRCHPIRSLSGPRKQRVVVTENKSQQNIHKSALDTLQAEAFACPPRAAALDNVPEVREGLTGTTLSLQPVLATDEVMPNDAPMDPQTVPPPRSPSPPPIVADESIDDDNSWMLLHSDSSTVEPLQSIPATAQESTGTIPNRRDQSTVYPRPPSRSPLKSLDRNLPMLCMAGLSKDGSITAARAMSSSTKSAAAKAQVSKSSPPRKRGRPRKEAADPAEPPLAKSVKRKGRPRKHTMPAALDNVSAPERADTPDFLDIDGITDSDSPITPSPPRRRARSASPAAIPLDLSFAAPAELHVIALAAGASSLKGTDPQWPERRAALFARITETVKAAPRSKDSSQPSWWQKILLYDPIVLEDLTAWLNEQKLRVEVKRSKPRVKKKGRKKRDGVEAVEEVEWELVQELLQPWMVQKWCEEMSVCCLWKNGLRGGVRVAY